MTALNTPGAVPSNDAEYVRQLYDKVRRLELARTVRAGSWVLSTDPETGGLLASRPGQRLLLNQVVETTTGVVGTRVIDAATGAAPDTSVLTEIAEALTGLLGLGQPDRNPLVSLKQWADNLRGLFSSVDFNESNLDTTSALTSWIQDRVKPLNLLLSDDSPLNPANIAGQISQAQVSGIQGAADIGESIQTTMDKLAQAAGNAADLINVDFGRLSSVFSAQQQQINDINEGLAALQSQSTAGSNSGKSVIVDFSIYPDAPSAPGIFTTIEDTGSGGYISTKAGRLEWVDGGSSGHRVIGLYNVEPLMTDYFETAMVMPRQNEDPWFGSPSYNFLIGRSNIEGTAYCQARIGFNNLTVGCKVNGVETWFDLPVSYTTPPGALVKFRGGTVGGTRIFQILVNNKVQATFTDANSVSMMGEQYRWCGAGFYAATRGAGQATPASVSVWTMNDNTPAETLGVGFRAYRASDASEVQDINGASPYGEGTIDTVDRITPGLVWNPQTHTLTVNIEGWYMFPMSATRSSGPNETEEFGPILYHTSGSTTTLHRGAVFKHPSFTGGNLFNENRVHGSHPAFYCKAGDTIQYGYMGIFPSIVGNGAGTITYVGAILLNRSAA